MKSDLLRETFCENGPWELRTFDSNIVIPLYIYISVPSHSLICRSFFFYIPANFSPSKTRIPGWDQWESMFSKQFQQPRYLIFPLLFIRITTGGIIFPRGKGMKTDRWKKRERKGMEKQQGSKYKVLYNIFNAGGERRKTGNPQNQRIDRWYDNAPRVLANQLCALSLGEQSVANVERAESFPLPPSFFFPSPPPLPPPSFPILPPTPRPGFYLSSFFLYFKRN